MKKLKIPAYLNWIPIVLITLLLGLAFYWRGNRQTHNYHLPNLQQLSLMTYNVDNLFDTTHDVGKADFTFLPLAKKLTREHTQFCRGIHVPKWRDQCFHLDWSPQILQRKMANLAQVILRVNAGKGPDILVLQEVENIAVLEVFRTQFLANAHYSPGILIEGMDPRGIDVAVLSRLPLAAPPLVHAKIMRPILQLALQLPNHQILHLLGVHFTAPFNSAKERIAGLHLLAQIKQSIQSKEENALVMVAGDFNITSEEWRKNSQIRSTLTQHWHLAHLQRPLNTRGSSYFPPKKSWSFLDMILYSSGLHPDKLRSGWQVRLDSIQVINQVAGQQTKGGHPQRFDVTNGKGHSDHWPLYLEIVNEDRANHHDDKL